MNEFCIIPMFMNKLRLNNYFINLKIQISFEFNLRSFKFIFKSFRKSLLELLV